MKGNRCTINLNLVIFYLARIDLSQWNQSSDLGLGSGFIANFFAWTESLWDPKFESFSRYYYESSASEYSSYDTICKCRGSFEREEVDDNWYSITPSSRYTSAWISSDQRGSLRVTQIDVSLAEAKIPSVLESKLLYGSDVITGTNYNDAIMSHTGADQIYAGLGDDVIHGNHGADIVDGGSGNDIVRGGHGHDELRGGTGSDFLWGGQGSNVLAAGIDTVKDDLYVPVDSVVNTNGNPGGANRDLLTEVTTEDRIYMHGIDDSALTYAAGVLDPKGSGLSGVGIYANGILEAIVHDSSGLNASQVNEITTGGVFA